MKGKVNPKFNQTLTFKEFFPPMFQRLKIQLRDQDAVADEALATHFIDLQEISHPDYNENDDASSASSYDSDIEESGKVFC